MSSLPNTGSIRRRLFVQLAVIAAILSMVFFLAVRVVAEQTVIDSQDKILAASATSIADTLNSERGAIRLEIPYSALSMLGAITEDHVFYRVVVDGKTLTGYDDLPTQKLISSSRDAAFETLVYRGEQVRSVSILRTISVDGKAQNVIVVVGQTRLGLEKTSSRITATAMAVGVGFFLIAIVLSLLAAQNALGPLKRLTGSITRRGLNDLRPVVSDTPAEMLPFVEALNNFMLRLSTSLNRSEDLITEAAHRIRTPLATVRTQAEVIHRQMKKSENKKAMRDMIRAVDESSRVAGQLLDHAMVNFRTEQLETQEVDLNDLLQDVCDRLAPTAELKDIHISLELPEQSPMIMGDRILLQNAVRNILDNAIKYSPAESEISVQLDDKSARHLIFKDQGRGFVDADIERLTERFSRGSNVSDVVGSGVGLTIANDVACAHGGHLELSSNPTGAGACVTLILPLL